MYKQMSAGQRLKIYICMSGVDNLTQTCTDICMVQPNGRRKNTGPHLSTG